jgi:hypothetical protein
MEVENIGTFYWWPNRGEVHFKPSVDRYQYACYDLMPSQQNREGAVRLACRQLPFILEGDVRI